MAEPALPGMPEPRPVLRKPPRPGIRAARTTARHLCQDCCELIHRLGASVAPYPMGGRWRVSTDEWVRYLCDRHKTERIE